MFDCYYLFILAFVLLWIGSTRADRGAVRVVLIATLASWAIKEFFTSGITSPWKLVVPCSVEAMTILSLLKWARNPSGWRQIDLLVVAWFAHFLCLLDLLLVTDMVYSLYEWILTAVTASQVLAFYDTIEHNLDRFFGWVGRLVSGRSDALDHRGPVAPLGHHPRSPGI